MDGPGAIQSLPLGSEVRLRFLPRGLVAGVATVLATLALLALWKMRITG